MLATCNRSNGQREPARSIVVDASSCTAVRSSACGSRGGFHLRSFLSSRARMMRRATRTLTRISMRRPSSLLIASRRAVTCTCRSERRSRHAHVTATPSSSGAATIRSCSTSFRVARSSSCARTWRISIRCPSPRVSRELKGERPELPRAVSRSRERCSALGVSLGLAPRGRQRTCTLGGDVDPGGPTLNLRALNARTAVQSEDGPQVDRAFERPYNCGAGLAGPKRRTDAYEKRTC
jgi:hypothetical protein